MGPRDVTTGTDQMQSKGREVGRKGTSGLGRVCCDGQEPGLGPELRVQGPSPPLTRWLTPGNSHNLHRLTFHSNKMEQTIPLPFRVARIPNEMMLVKFRSVHCTSQMEGVLSVLFTDESPAPNTGPGPQWVINKNLLNK